MADLRFFDRVGPFSLDELSRVSGAQPSDGADPQRQYSDVATLETAGPSDVVFLLERKLKDALAASKAGLCVLKRDFAALAPEGMTCLFHDDPKRAFALIAQAFYPTPPPRPLIASTASIDPSAKLGADVRIDPGAVIGPNVVIGDRVHVGANAVIGRSVKIGDDSVIGPLAVLQYCEIGKWVIIHPGVAIGQDGFGYVISMKGDHIKLPQLGLVLISDHVEIGANTTIDRGASGDTIIGPHTKIDNLVQIAHNVRIGMGCGITSQVGISGSTTIGNISLLYGQVGVADHARIGSGVVINARSGVQGHVPDGATYMGYPAVPMKEYIGLQKFLIRSARKAAAGKAGSDTTKD